MKLCATDTYHKRCSGGIRCNSTSCIFSFVEEYDPTIGMYFFTLVCTFSWIFHGTRKSGGMMWEILINILEEIIYFFVCRSQSKHVIKVNYSNLLFPVGCLENSLPTGVSPVFPKYIFWFIVCQRSILLLFEFFHNSRLIRQI